MVSTGKGDGSPPYMERCTIEMLDIKETLIQSQNQCFLNQRFPFYEWRTITDKLQMKKDFSLALEMTMRVETEEDILL